MFGLARKTFGCLLFLGLVCIIAIAVVTWIGYRFLGLLAEGELKSRTGFQTQISEYKVRPLDLAITVGDVRIENPPRFPEADFIELDRAEVDLQFRPLSDTVVIDRMVLDLNSLTLVTLPNGENNLRNFIRSWSRVGRHSSDAPEAFPRAFRIEHFQVRLHTLRLLDYSAPVTLERSAEVDIDVQRKGVSDVSQIVELLGDERGGVGLSLLVTHFLDLIVSSGFPAGYSERLDKISEDILRELEDRVVNAGELLKNVIESVRKNRESNPYPGDGSGDGPDP